MTIKNGHSSLCKFTKQVQTIKQASPSLLQQKENNWLSVFNGARQTRGTHHVWFVCQYTVSLSLSWQFDFCVTKRRTPPATLITEMQTVKERTYT